MAKKINCRLCVNMETDNFTCVHYCKKTGQTCHIVASDFNLKANEPYPAIVPDAGVKVCPGMVKHHIE